MRRLSWPIKLEVEPRYLDCICCATPFGVEGGGEGTGAGPAEHNAVVRMFHWWNRAYREDGFTPQAFAEHFTEDAVMVINGEVRGRDLESLAAHFQRIRAAHDHVGIVLPMEETFAAREDVFVHYRARAVTNGVERVEDVLASARLSGGRIRFFNGNSRVVG